MTKTRAAVMAAVITAGLLVAPAAAQARPVHHAAARAASTLQPPARRTGRHCPREYWDHELGCVLWRVPRRW